MTMKLIADEEPAFFKNLSQRSQVANRSLRSLGTWSGGGTPSKAVAAFWTGGTIPWVSPKDMKVARLRDAEDHITPDAVASSATSLVRAGAVVLVVRSGILKHSLPVAVTDVDVALNQDLKALQPAAGVEAAYVAWALRANAQRILHGCTKAGTTVQSIEMPALLDFEIPLPMPAEQRCVVETVEAQLSLLDASVAGLQRVQANLKRYRASVLKSACEGRLVPTEAELARQEGRDFETGAQLMQRAGTRRSDRSTSPPETKGLLGLPEAWALASVDMVGDVLLGRQRAPQYLTGESTHCYLRVANIKDDRIDFDDLNEMDFDSSHFAKYRLEPGDILVSEGQSPELLGQSAIFRGYSKALCFQKTLHRFRAYAGLVTPEFAQLVFRSHLYSGVFRKFGSITTNIGHLTLNRFKAVWFPLPPLAEQHRIVAEADRRLSLIRVAEAQVAANLARAQRLRQSILQAAFAGPG